MIQSKQHSGYLIDEEVDESIFKLQFCNKAAGNLAKEPL